MFLSMKICIYLYMLIILGELQSGKSYEKNKIKVKTFFRKLLFAMSYSLGHLFHV